MLRYLLTRINPCDQIPCSGVIFGEDFILPSWLWQSQEIPVPAQSNCKTTKVKLFRYSQLKLFL